MKFRTIVELPEYNFKISHKKKCLLTGSCFANNIGEVLTKNKFPCIYNPTGILYNPFSISESIETALSRRTVTKSELFYDNGLWNHYNFHSSFSSPDAEKCLENINTAIHLTSSALISGDFLFISFGTAYCYILKDSDSIVSNCHKQNPSIFERKLLTVAEISKKLTEISKKLLELNPKLKIIFTISPIRHWKDGAINNQISKSSLFLAIKSVMENLSAGTAYYFPAYEIVQDELRDYRFYAEDMLHPSVTAINYLWEKFGDAFFDSETKKLNDKIAKIIKASEHKPFNRDTKEYRDFCEKYLKLIEDIEREFPELDFSLEKTVFQE